MNPQILAFLDRAVTLAVAEARRDQMTLPPVVAETVAEIQNYARAARLGVPHGMRGIPHEGDFETVKAMTSHMTSQQAAKALGNSSRAVTAMAKRGTLPGRLTPAGWEFDPIVVAEYATNRSLEAK